MPDVGLWGLSVGCLCVVDLAYQHRGYSVKVTFAMVASRRCLLIVIVAVALAEIRTLCLKVRNYFIFPFLCHICREAAEQLLCGVCQNQV